MAVRGEKLDDRLIAVHLLEVEDGIDLALRVLLARRRTIVLRRGPALAVGA